MRRLLPPLLLAAACGRESPSGKPDADADTGAPAACPLDWSGPPTAWALPGGMALPVAEHPEATCETDGRGAWTLRDMDGDGLADLLVTRDCADATVGDVAWRVHRSTGAGFGAAEAWTLPDDGAVVDAWGTTERAERSCDAGAERSAYVLRDLDGDARPDLVELATCADEGVGVVAWRFHRNVGTGFAAAVDWPLPNAATGLSALRPTLDCRDGDLPSWDLLDLDGDALPDLIRLGDCDEGTSPAAWTVWRNEGPGFAAAGVSWDVPVEADRLRHETVVCSRQLPAWFVDDLDGDARPDFVVVRDCEVPETGSVAWAAWRNRGDRFDGEPTSWALPTGYAAYGFSSPPPAEDGCARGLVAWDLVDADGAGGPDLLVMDDCRGALVGDTHWRVHADLGADASDAGSDVSAAAEGFAAAGTAVYLPSGYTARAFAPPAADAPDCGTSVSTPAWARVSLDADGRPDLVVTAACDDPDVGATTWRAHLSGCGG